ncbi:MAG TPA: hypothetical protein VK447_12120 [Myxococcaceae bacterium]|nr:hypothetical protein [Myxococcaceae bacterium]
MGKDRRPAPKKPLSDGRRRVADDVEQFESLKVFQGGPKPRRLFYFTQPDWCINWLNERRFPERWHVLSRLYEPTESFLETVRRYAAWSRLPLLFVGDLDPHNLFVFALLRYGNTEFKSRRRDAIPVRYLGIDDRWIQLCADQLKRGEELVTLRLKQHEEETLRVVKEVLPDLPELVGPRSYELLDTGRLFPFGAATNPLFYKRGFHDRLIEHLDTAPARVPRALRR